MQYSTKYNKTECYENKKIGTVYIQVNLLLCKVKQHSADSSIERVVPVSYTHLDVYKRQGLTYR